MKDAFGVERGDAVSKSECECEMCEEKGIPCSKCPKCKVAKNKAATLARLATKAPTDSGRGLAAFNLAQARSMGRAAGKSGNPREIARAKELGRANKTSANYLLSPVKKPNPTRAAADARRVKLGMGYADGGRPFQLYPRFAQNQSGYGATPLTGARRAMAAGKQQGVTRPLRRPA